MSPYCIQQLSRAMPYCCKCSNESQSLLLYSNQFSVFRKQVHHKAGRVPNDPWGRCDITLCDIITGADAYKYGLHHKKRGAQLWTKSLPRGPKGGPDPRTSWIPPCIIGNLRVHHCSLSLANRVSRYRHELDVTVVVWI